jgi:hypothetical protein
MDADALDHGHVLLDDEMAIEVHGFPGLKNEACGTRRFPAMLRRIAMLPLPAS